ncbi:hypothetical protein DFJ73DRAFT_967753 [Zopfochytrium polystomum]|nr:hypothetical protein DFJ73DRAFT_967753 [Zopfochytrium polystomum]
MLSTSSLVSSAAHDCDAHEAYASPDEAVALVREILPSLTAHEANMLRRCLDPKRKDAGGGSGSGCSDVDPVLAVKINPAWVAVHGQPANAVLDNIAHYQRLPMLPRRDEDAPGFLFHFERSSDIVRCQAAVAAAHPGAFAISPVAVAHGALGLSVEPMAFTAMIHKIDIKQSDVHVFRFFYF